MIELLVDCYHLQWYFDASEYLPEEDAAYVVVRLLEIYRYEAYEERHSCLHLILCSLRTTNIISVVERSG